MGGFANAQSGLDYHLLCIAFGRVFFKAENQSLYRFLSNALAVLLHRGLHRVGETSVDIVGKSANRELVRDADMHHLSHINHAIRNAVVYAEHRIRTLLLRKESRRFSYCFLARVSIMNILL